MAKKRFSIIIIIKYICKVLDRSATKALNGKWNSYTLQCGTIITLISPGDCTCNVTWLWEHDSEFTKWHHPAM